MTLPDTFWQKVSIRFGEAGCWRWGNAKTVTGYGQFWLGNKLWLTHRLVYTAMRGEIPPGLTIDHVCQQKDCVNPEHMELVTRGENSVRGGGLAVANERQRQKTHCKHGHEFTPENTKRWGTRRQCRTCHRALKQRLRQEAKYG